MKPGRMEASKERRIDDRQEKEGKIIKNQFT